MQRATRAPRQARSTYTIETTIRHSSCNISSKEITVEPTISFKVSPFTGEVLETRELVSLEALTLSHYHHNHGLIQLIGTNVGTSTGGSHVKLTPGSSPCNVIFNGHLVSFFCSFWCVPRYDALVGTISHLKCMFNDVLEWAFDRSSCVTLL